MFQHRHPPRLQPRTPRTKASPSWDKVACFLLPIPQLSFLEERILGRAQEQWVVEKKAQRGGVGGKGLTPVCFVVIRSLFGLSNPVPDCKLGERRGYPNLVGPLEGVGQEGTLDLGGHGSSLLLGRTWTRLSSLPCLSKSGFRQPEPEDPSCLNVPEPGCMASGHSQSLSPWFPGLNSEWLTLVI